MVSLPGVAMYLSNTDFLLSCGVNYNDMLFVRKQYAVVHAAISLRISTKLLELSARLFFCDINIREDHP